MIEVKSSTSTCEPGHQLAQARLTVRDLPHNPDLALAIALSCSDGREQQMQRFKSREQTQRFLSSRARIYDYFRPQRHLMATVHYRRARTKAFWVWHEETCVRIAA